MLSVLEEALTYISKCIEFKDLKLVDFPKDPPEDEVDTLKEKRDNLDTLEYFVSNIFPLLVRTVLRKKYLSILYSCEVVLLT